MSDWTDAIIGERMTVDGTFSDRVAASRFSNAEWDLIMTATEFEIERADDPEAARIVANTENVPAIIPELAAIRAQTASMAGQPNTGGRDSDGGLVDAVKRALGFGGDTAETETVDQEALAAAEELTQAYAESLQAHLEETGSFERARAAYRDR
ncbi:MAG: DUF5799 family protein [Halohasta sp.]